MSDRADVDVETEPLDEHERRRLLESAGIEEGDE